MSYHSKRRIVNTVVYMVLSLIVVSVLCITVVSFVSANRKKKPLPVTSGDVSSDNASADADSALTGLFGKDEPSDPADQPTPPADEPSEPSETPTGKDDRPDEPDNSKDSGEIPTNTEPERHYTLPVKGYVQKEFSVALPVWSKTMEDHRAHCGIDISAAVGDAVCSIASGVVVEVRTDPLMGKTLSIAHADGLTSIYAGLSEELAEGIAPGAAVGEGQVLGAVGDTALAEIAETDHLHFELRKDGSLVDPTEYLDYSTAPKEDTGTE